MTECLVCHRELPPVTELKSPFSKLIALGYYDGPTSGLVQCDTCSAVYRFEMLDWDEDEDVRIFSLSPLPAEAFDQIVKVCEQSSSPKWPIWVPIWKFASSAEENQANQEIEQILNQAKNPQLIVAAQDLTQEIIATQKVEIDNLNQVKDWFSQLGLSKALK